MPYTTNKDLPQNVQDNLPRKAQTMFREAYNSAYEAYKDPKKRRDDASHEETAHKVAWSAVQKEYKKRDDEWVKK